MRLFIIAAIVCFVLAVLVALGVFNGISVIGLDSGGLLAWAIYVAYVNDVFATPTRNQP